MTMQRPPFSGQIPPEIASQLETAQKFYKSLPQEVKSLLQRVIESNSYITMQNNSQTTDIIEAQFSQEQIPLKKFFDAIRSLSPSDMEFITSTITTKEFLKQSGIDSDSSNLHAISVDIPCTITVSSPPNNSSWLYLRKIIYPIVHERLAATIALFNILLNYSNNNNMPHLCPLFVFLAVIAYIVDKSGCPKESDDKSN